jgi:predicted secreted protein
MRTRSAGRSDDGKTFALSLGGDFVVELDENPTTGYLWAIDAMDMDRLGFVRSSFRPGAGVGSHPGSGDAGGGGSGAIGGGGQRVLLFQAKAIGEAHLGLKLLREWVGAASVIDRCAFRLRIAEDRTARDDTPRRDEHGT